MTKNKYIKILVSSFLILITLWVAVPKVYIHALLGHNHSFVKVSAETKLKTQTESDNCDVEKYNKPAYFNLFKFICSFIPIKSKNANKISEKAINLSLFSVVFSSLRGPPVSE